MDIDFNTLSPEQLDKLIKDAARFKATGVTTTDPAITKFADDIKAFAESKNLDPRGVINAVSFAVLGPTEKVEKGKKGQKTPLQEACKSVGVAFKVTDSIPDLKDKLQAAGYHYEAGKAVKI